MKRVKKGRSCYSIGGVVLDENQPITQPALPQSQVSNFIASVRPDASTIVNSDLGFAASQSAQDGVHRGATAIQPPSSFSQSAGIIGGPRYEPINSLDNGSNPLVGQSQGQQPQAQQQLAPRGSFVDYMGGRLGNNNNSVSSLQAAAAEDANKRIKNILSGPYRYDRAGNRKYLGGNPYSPSLVAAATPSPLGYGEQDRANRRRTTVPAVPYGYEEKSYSNGGIVEGASEALLRKMAEKYGIANPPPESMRPVEVKPQAAQQKKSEPPRRGFRTAERWREGGDYPIDVKYADGGRVIPVNIGQGLYQAIAQPIAEDWKQGNVAIKNVRDQYPIADTIAGIHPAVAAAQVANDVMSGQVSGDTAMNVAQAVPMVKGLSGMAKLSSKQSGPTVGGTKFVVDMPGTVKKNMALTAGQAIGYPAKKYADGGIVAFKGKGGPRDDKIPVTVAGEKIMVSNGEKAVILPAKTAANPAALGIIGGLIEHTNDGRKPKMGMRDGGKYARGAVPVRQYPDEIDIARGLMETENARAADAAARAMAARAGAVVPVAAPDPYQPNWTQPRNVPAQFVRPAVEGVVETVADQRAASMAAHPKALNAPTGLVPPVSQPNWTAGGVPPNVGPVGGGQWANQGWNAPPGRATMPQGGGIQSAVQALPAPPHETVKAVNDARTAATARSAGRASNEAAAYANRPAFETSPAANVGPNAALAGKIVRRTIPVVGGAISAGNIADVATDPNKTGADVATQVAREAGGWGAAVAGGAAGAKVGSALGALGGPLAPITIPAGALIGGIGGGLAANYGANALMDLGGEAPAKTSNGVVSRLFGGNQQQAAVDPTRTKHNAILNSGAGTGEIRLPIDKRAAYANTAAVQSAAANQDAGATVRNGIVQADMGRGFDPTKLQMAPGYGMASNAAGKTIGGNMSPNQYVAADGTPNARWEETQQYKDAIARNERMKLELAAIQAGKKRGADPMAIQTAQQGIAGAMIGNQAKQEEMQRNDQSNALLKTAMNTKDPAQHRTALQNYLASRGVAMKDPDDWEIMAGGERSVPNGLGGFQVVKDPPIAFHKPTRQWIKADGSIGQSDGASQPKQAPQAAIEYLRANPGTAEQFKQRYGYLPQ